MKNFRVMLLAVGTILQSVQSAKPNVEELVQALEVVKAKTLVLSEVLQSLGKSGEEGAPAAPTFTAPEAPSFEAPPAPEGPPTAPEAPEAPDLGGAGGEAPAGTGEEAAAVEPQPKFKEPGHENETTKEFRARDKAWAAKRNLPKGFATVTQSEEGKRQKELREAKSLLKNFFNLLEKKILHACSV